jgi:hypothetical protein
VDATVGAGGAIVADRRIERLDDLSELRRLAVLQQQIEEGCGFDSCRSASTAASVE